MENVPQFYARDRKSWRAWLEKNHASQDAIWLVFDKGEHRTMSWPDIVEEALCFGWIDSRPGKVSETQTKLYISKRKPKSVWSKINKEAVERLITSGKMTPAGLKSIEIAKENGSWYALDLSDNLVYPTEFAELLDTNPAAKNNFENFPVGSRRNTLQWMYDAKTPETRMKRIHAAVEAAEKNQKLR